MYQPRQVVHSQAPAHGVVVEVALHSVVEVVFPEEVPEEGADKFHLPDYQKKITFATKREK